MTAYTGKDIMLSPSSAATHVNQQASNASPAQPMQYNVAMGEGPLSSLIQSRITPPGVRSVGEKFGVTIPSPVQPRTILQHDTRPPHDISNRGPSPTQHNPLTNDLQQLIHNLPSMSQPPPPIRNPRPQPVQPQYMAASQAIGHEIRTSPTAQTNAAYQIGQPVDYRKSPVPQTSPAKHASVQFGQTSQPRHQSSSPHFPGQMPNPAFFHQQKQMVGQPFHPSVTTPSVRPALTSSRSAGNIPTVAETLFGEHGLPGTRGINPLASIFSQQQGDNG